MVAGAGTRAPTHAVVRKQLKKRPSVQEHAPTDSICPQTAPFAMAQSDTRSHYSISTVLAACAIFAGVFIAIFLVGKAVEKCQEACGRQQRRKRVGQRQLRDEMEKKAA